MDTSIFLRKKRHQQRLARQQRKDRLAEVLDQLMAKLPPPDEEGGAPVPTAPRPSGPRPAPYQPSCTDDPLRPPYDVTTDGASSNKPLAVGSVYGGGTRQLIQVDPDYHKRARPGTFEAAAGETLPLSVAEFDRHMEGFSAASRDYIRSRMETTPA